MRLAVGGIEHESSNFTTVETPLSFFLRRRNYWEGENLLQRPGDTNTIIDGLLQGVRRYGEEVIPLIWTKAPSGKQPTLETHEELKRRLMERLQPALPVDGVLLSLHGAYSVQGLDDGDGDILKAVRAQVGPDCPIISVHDLHCNIGPDMAHIATALIVEDTYPHVDMAERGMEAAAMMVRTIRGEIRPTMGWRPIPLLWSAPHMITAEVPMATVMEQVFDLEKEPGVLTASLSVGYQWVDSDINGASTIVVTDNDPQGAQQKADQLAGWIWERRSTWICSTLTPSDGLKRGEAIGKYPIILADQADNSGGGAPSDSTEILRLFIERNLQEAAVLYMVDPETAQQAKRAGVGSKISVEVGGKSHALCGPPVPMRAKVLALTDGRFVYDGPMFANLATTVGDSALLQQGGVYVVVISLPNQPIDLALSRTLGLDCRKMRYLCLKSTGHFRSGFGPVAGSIFNVDAAGAMVSDFSKLPFRRLGRRVYPLHQDAQLGF